MRNNPMLAFTIFSLIILAIDSYSYWGINKIIKDHSNRFKLLVRILFWVVPVLVLSGLISISLFRHQIPADKFLSFFHILSGFFILFYIPKLVFVVFNIFDDVIFQIRKINASIKHKSSDLPKEPPKISRRKFLNQVGIIFAAIPFLSLLYGISYGRFNFTVRNIKLKFASLPEKFNGLRIVHISDFHLGSFLNDIDQVKKAVDIINEQNADLLLFTGDLVNNVASEIDDFSEILKSTRAKFGKYSILGNHDYGDYARWNSDSEKVKNFDQMTNMQREMGFDLLLNESRKIEIDGEFIDLLGVENWGLPPFPQYGDLNKALMGADKNSFKILMSHDPTHWDEEILDKTDIDLTLSGHTHGAQFGIEIPGWRWSPVSLRYKRWGGAYTEGKQSIFVNTGIGFIAFPGRVGIPPEIAVIELEKI